MQFVNEIDYSLNTEKMNMNVSQYTVSSHYSKIQLYSDNTNLVTTNFYQNDYTVHCKMLTSFNIDYNLNLNDALAVYIGVKKVFPIFQDINENISTFYKVHVAIKYCHKANDFIDNSKYLKCLNVWGN